MSAVVRILETPEGETVPVPDEFDHAMGRWYENEEQRRGALFRVADNLLLLLREHELAVVPLAFVNGSSQAVDLNVYTQALVWKANAERRAAAAERELAELQALFVDPPHTLLPSEAGEEAASSPTEGSEATVMGLMTPPSAMSGHLPADDGSEDA